MSKTKLLMCAESSHIKSGFGLYTREILSRLHKTNLFEIAELSCYATIEQKANVPWKIYANAVAKDHPQAKHYHSNATNAFGLWRFDKVLLDFQPDIVFDMRDYWMMSYQESSVLREYFNWVIAPTVDSIPQQQSWMNTFKNADLVLAHTDWAIDYLKEANMSIKTGKAVPDSVDTDNYSPISYSKNFHKNKMLAPTDSFIIGSVMRNQKRKLIPNLFLALRNLIQYTNNHNIFLCLHTSYPEATGWDIPAYLQEYGVYNNVLFTYYCQQCNKVHVSRFQNNKKPCPLCNKGLCSFPHVQNGPTDQQMAEIYNLFDFYVQYAICEGLGIPQLEAASCGIPLCSVDYSAMSEVTSKLEAYKVSYALQREMETGAQRAVPNDSHLVQIIYDYMKLPEEEKKKIAERTRANVLTHYSWDKTAEILKEQLLSLPPKNKWHEKITTNHELKVPAGIASNREFIKFLIFHVIKSPHLWNSALTQKMIHDLDIGVHEVNKTLQPYNREKAVKMLERILNHKMYIKDIQYGKVKNEEDFILVANGKTPN